VPGENGKEKRKGFRTGFIVTALLCVISGAFLALGFPPFSQPYMVFFALIPILLRLRKTGPVSAFLGGWLGGAVFFGMSLYWIALPTVLGYFICVFCLSFYFAFFALFSSFVLKGGYLYRVLMVPVIWVFFEFLRGAVPAIGFEYVLCGYPLVHFPKIIQFADITGIYGVSFMVVLVNVLAAEVIASFFIFEEGRISRRVRFAFSVVLAASVFAGALAYGYWRVGSLTEKKGIEILTVQPSVPQNKKFSAGYENLVDTRLKQLTQDDRRAMGVDLLIWPETSLFGSWPPAKGFADTASNEASGFKTNVLIGALERQPFEDGFKQYNTAVFYDRKGRLKGKYQKQYRVPAGEYTFEWLESIWPEAGKLFPFRVAYERGEQGFQTFQAANERFAVLICYEITFARLVRESVRDPRVTILVNLSNEAWFGDSAELDQMHDIARVRAIENRIAVVRSTNSGVSSIIAPSGRVVGVIKGEDGKTKEVIGYLKGRVAITDCGSVYRSYGDVFIVAIFILGAILVAARLSFNMFLKRPPGDAGSILIEQRIRKGNL